jgi:hypothetical protein
LRTEPTSFSKFEKAGFFILAALVPLPRLLRPDTVSELSAIPYRFFATLDHMVLNLTAPASRWIELLWLQMGNVDQGADCITYLVWLKLFFTLFGITMKAVTFSAVAAHAVFVASLWLLARWSFGTRSILLIGLVFFATPWYQAAILSNTILGFSLALSCLGFALTLRSVELASPRLAALAGFVLGINFYGYAVARLYSLILLAAVVATPWLMTVGTRRQRFRVVGAVLLFFAIALGPNLLDPVRISPLSWDVEVVTGPDYLPGQEFSPSALAAGAIDNLSRFLVADGPEFRHHGWFFDKLVLLLFVYGTLVAFRKRRPEQILFALTGIAAWVSLSFWAKTWTQTRTAMLCLPFLIVVAAGLEEIGGKLSKRFGWNEKRGMALIVVFYLLFSLGSNLSYRELDRDEASLLPAAVELAKRNTPICAVFIQKPDAEEDAWVFRFALAGAGKLDQARYLTRLYNPTAEQMNATAGCSDQEKILVTFKGISDPARPSAVLNPFFASDSEFTLYEFLP